MPDPEKPFDWDAWFESVGGIPVDLETFICAGCGERLQLLAPGGLRPACHYRPDRDGSGLVECGPLRIAG